MPSPSEIGASHYHNRQQLASNAATVAADEWAKVDRSDIAQSWLARLPFVGAIVAAAQLGAARQAEPYMAEATAAQGLASAAEALLSTAAFAGAASDGRELLSLLFQPVIAALTTMRDGATIDEAMATGHATLEMIVRTQVPDAGRIADQVAMAARPKIEGYTRIVVGRTCNRCIILAGRFYSYNEGFRRHPRCDCLMLPTSQADAAALVQDPMAIYEEMTERERTEAGWSQADQQAIDAGADINQVTNAQRGTYTAGGRRFTREGVTGRGVFGGYTVDPETGRLRRRTGRAPARLTPDQIFEDAAGRDEAIDLLIENGYLLDPVRIRREPERETQEEPTTEPQGRLSWLDDDDEDWGAIVAAAEEAKPADVRELLIRKDDEREARPTVDIGRLATDPLKPLTKKRRAGVDQAARELFDGVYAGIEAKVTSVEVGDFNRMTVVQGDLLDAAGRKVGYFVRGYRYVDRYPGPGRDLVARHESLEITDRDLRGQGFATAFNGHLEASYRASGVDRITLTASLDNGGYAWARAGYDWASEWTAANIATSLKRQVQLLEASPSDYGGRDVHSAIAEAKALLERMDGEPFGSAGFPTPYELSQIGRWDGAGRDDVWLGKQALLGRTWEGVKPL